MDKTKHLYAPVIRGAQQVLRHALRHALRYVLRRVFYVLVLHMSPKGRRRAWVRRPPWLQPDLVRGRARVRVAARRSIPLLAP